MRREPRRSGRSPQDHCGFRPDDRIIGALRAHRSSAYCPYLPKGATNDAAARRCTERAERDSGSAGELRAADPFGSESTRVLRSVSSRPASGPPLRASRPNTGCARWREATTRFGLRREPLQHRILGWRTALARRCAWTERTYAPVSTRHDFPHKASERIASRFGTHSRRRNMAHACPKKKAATGRRAAWQARRPSSGARAGDRGVRRATRKRGYAGAT